MEDFWAHKRLQCLLQVIETGSVRAAAEQLQTDPSAVSRSIARLEEQLGLRLLEKRGRGVVPTDAGKALSFFAMRQQDLQGDFMKEVERIKQARAGSVNLVFGEGFIDWVFSGILAPFLMSHPDIRCQIQIEGTAETIRRIVEEESDFGLVFQPPSDVRLRSHYSRRAPIRVHVHRSHDLARLRRPVQFQDLLPYQGASLGDEFGVRKQVDMAELDERVRLRPMLLTNSFRVLWQFAMAGIGYVMSPRSQPFKGSEFKAMVSLPLANPLLNSSFIHVVSRSGRYLSPIANKMLSHVVRGMPPT
ncbi:MAG: LysR family transcriptional regulator [Curvibacter sp.]|nr:LysR family transcriptional regulator [Curvibacter sp.]